ncbi:probable G-protein coupled receptor 139 [Physella acuta]|uniref:probable G-protein coupled receptor 139 n=1 Tax=Physella acuta TaxID=109671 RepID=UPI0027DB8FE5|nr:probable G-protein coupled receptor 139 [Physella acuta]
MTLDRSDRVRDLQDDRQEDTGQDIQQDVPQDIEQDLEEDRPVATMVLEDALKVLMMLNLSDHHELSFVLRHKYNLTDDLISAVLNRSTPIFKVMPEFKVAKVLLLYVPPVLLVMGTMGNLLSFLILRHKSMNQQSIYVYLSTLAIFDSLVLYFGLLRLWVDEVSGLDIRTKSTWLCKGLLMLNYTSSDVSVWLIVAVTFERYVIVSHPLQAPHFCQDSRAKKIIAGIILVFLLVNFHFLFTVDLNPSKASEQKRSVRYECSPNPGYEHLIQVVWPWVDALLYGFGPFVLISVFNSIIVFKICKANNSRAQLVQGRVQRNSSPVEAGNIRITVMLLTISFSFLLTTLPSNLSNIVSYWVNINGSQLTQTKAVLMTAVSSLLMYLNHSVNFILYCATGRRFRAMVTRCFCSKIIRPRTVPTLDHSHHLFCSRKRLDGQKSATSEESQV